MREPRGKEGIVPRSSRKTVEEAENRVLAVVEAVSAPRRPACLSLRDLARATELTEGRVRSALRGMVAHGLVTAEARYADDGGQLANGYRLTAAGRERLRAAGGPSFVPSAIRTRSRDPSAVQRHNSTMEMKEKSYDC